VLNIEDKLFVRKDKKTIMDNKYIVAFDFGSETTSVAVGISDSSQQFGVNVLYQETVPSKGFRRGTIGSISEVQSVIAPLWDNAKRQMKNNYGYIIIANIGGLNYRYEECRKIFNVQNVDIDQKLIEDFRKKAEESYYVADDEEVVRFLDKAYSIDSGKSFMSVIGKTGSKLEARYLACIIKKEVAEQINKTIPKRMTASKFYTSASAKGAIYLNNEDKKNVVALVDLGATTTNIAVYSQGCLSAEASLPFGSDTITNDIVQGLELTKQQAIELKHFYGLNSKEIITQRIPEGKRFITNKFADDTSVEIDFDKYDFIVRARVQEIASYVWSVIAKFRLTNNLSYILLVGGGAELKGIATEFYNATLKETRVASLPLNIDVTSPIIGAIGMIALYVSENEEDNLLTQKVEPEPIPMPEEQEEKKEERENRKEDSKSGKEKKGFFHKFSAKMNGMFEAMNDGPSLGDEKED